MLTAKDDMQTGILLHYLTYSDCKSLFVAAKACSQPLIPELTLKYIADELEMGMPSYIIAVFIDSSRVIYPQVLYVSVINSSWRHRSASQASALLGRQPRP